MSPCYIKKKRCVYIADFRFHFSACLPVHVFFWMSNCPIMCLTIRLFVNLSIRLFVCFLMNMLTVDKTNIRSDRCLTKIFYWNQLIKKYLHLNSSRPFYFLLSFFNIQKDRTNRAASLFTITFPPHEFCLSKGSRKKSYFLVARPLKGVGGEGLADMQIQKLS